MRYFSKVTVNGRDCMDTRFAVVHSLFARQEGGGVVRHFFWRTADYHDVMCCSRRHRYHRYLLNRWAGPLLLRRITTGVFRDVLLDQRILTGGGWFLHHWGNCGRSSGFWILLTPNKSLKHLNPLGI